MDGRHQQPEIEKLELANPDHNSSHTEQGTEESVLQFSVAKMYLRTEFSFVHVCAACHSNNLECRPGDESIQRVRYNGLILQNHLERDSQPALRILS